MAQHLEGMGFEQGVAGPRVVVSIDGGRKTAKGCDRYKRTWREPKLFVVYMVDAEVIYPLVFRTLTDESLRFGQRLR